MSDDTDGSDRRINERRPLRVPAKVLTPEGRVMDVCTIDISDGGMAIASPVNPTHGTVFTIGFSLPKRPNGNVVIQERVQVMHSVFSGDVQAFKVGLMFIDLSAPAAEIILNFVRRT